MVVLFCVVFFYLTGAPHGKTFIESKQHEQLPLDASAPDVSLVDSAWTTTTRLIASSGNGIDFRLGKM